MKFNKITIVGLGLLGGSLGLEIKRKALAQSVCGFARNPETAKTALARHVVDECTDDLKTALSGADLAVFCVPVMVAAKMFEQVDLFENFTGIVTDVCSTKKMLCITAQENKNLADNYIGAHPMAGSEQSGIAAARQGLFEGSVCFVTPAPGVDEEKRNKVENFWQAVGCRINNIAPADHDRVTAAVSHLPHLLANAFVDCVSDSGIDSVDNTAGPGFYDFTRIAGGSAPMWRDIFVSNADQMEKLLSSFISELEEYKSIFAEANWEKLYGSLEKTSLSKTKYLKKD